MLQICYSGNPAYSWKAAGLSTENSMSIQNLKEQECCHIFTKLWKKGMIPISICIIVKYKYLCNKHKYLTSINILHQEIFYINIYIFLFSPKTLPGSKMIGYLIGY